MLTIICGEDEVGSRAYVNDLKKHYASKGYDMYEVGPRDIGSILNDDLGASSLFGSQSVYITSGLNSLIGRKKTNNEFLQQLDQLSVDQDKIVIDWEEGVSLRDIKIKNVTAIKEFKPSQTIFALLDSCYPGNKALFITMLSAVGSSQEEGFIFIMLARHIRQLLLAAYDALPVNTPPWQKNKLKSLAGKWSKPKLLQMYHGLARLDQGLKTSTNTYGYIKAIEILACYCL
ncbi:hypothetical protein HGB07_04530 [Candidatus Roizmanbacteria bacterium]|nr:hypothetical protein [Candidatus Roizmanbacteria bacterium]